MADGSFGCSWGGGYRVHARERDEGKRRQAHRGCDGGLGELGEAPEPTNLTKMAGGSEVEDDGDGGDAGAPAVCFSARRKRGSGRISWVLRVAVRSTVATANGVGDDELRSGACRERAEEGTGSRGREGRCRGEGECVAPSGASSGERVSRRWPERARARRAHALLPTGRRLKTVATAVGWAAQCWTSTGAGPALVGCTGKLCSFYFFLFCFVFI